MSQRHESRVCSTCVLLAALLVGCKAKPAEPAGFADPAQMKHDPSVPFDRFWRKPGADLNRYSKLHVADVNTAYMLKQTDWQKGERKKEIEQDVQALRAQRAAEGLPRGQDVSL